MLCPSFTLPQEHGAGKWTSRSIRAVLGRWSGIQGGARSTWPLQWSPQARSCSSSEERGANCVVRQGGVNRDRISSSGDESTVASLAPECFLQTLSGLFLLIIISCSLLLLSLTINLFVAFFYFLPVCCTSYNLSCKLQKTLVHVYLCTVQSCSSTAPVSVHCCINSNDVRERQEKNQSWEVFLDDVFTVISHIAATRRQGDKQQRQKCNNSSSLSPEHSDHAF